MVSVFFNDLYVNFQNNFDGDNLLKNPNSLFTRFNNLFYFYYNFQNVDYYKEKYTIDPSNIPEYFDINQKYLSVTDKNITFLKLRLKDSKEWSKILNLFIDKPNIPILHMNSTASKSINKYYSFFKENYKIPSNFYEVIKNNKSFKYYYSKEEQEQYLLQFKDKITDIKWNPYTQEQLMLYFSIIKENEVTIRYNPIIMYENSPIISNCLCESCTKKKHIFQKVLNNKFIHINEYNEIKHLINY